MKRNISTLIFILLPFGFTYQSKMDNDDFTIIVKDSRTVSDIVELKSTYYHIYNYSRDLKKARVRISVKSNSNKLKIFDPNKLYLVSDELKLRYRPIDIQLRFLLNEFQGLTRLTTDSTLSFIKYDPNIKDSFKDFSIIGYQDVECEINYGNMKKPKNALVYFEPIKVIEYVFDVYFFVPQSLTTGEFYFGDRDLKQCHFVK